METVIRDFRDLDQDARSALERIVGHQLGESHRLVIHVMNMTDPHHETDQPQTDGVPEYWRIYEGLSDAEIDELDRSIVRSRSSRNVD